MLILTIYFLFNIYLVSCSFNINDEVLFGISWKNEILTEDPSRFITIHSKDKESFRCILPSNVKDKYDSSFKEDYHGPTEMELLQPLFTSKLCSVKIESYWTYEICHGRHVRQFHEETNQGKSTTLQQYHLGTFVKEAHEPIQSTEKLDSNTKYKQLPTITINSVNFPYFRLNMTNGTKCDLIGQSRSISVLYVCQRDGRGDIYEIQEIGTCHYQAVVFTKLLCSHPGYKITDNLVNEIACYPVKTSPTMPKSLALLHEEMKSEMNSISTLDGLFNDNFNLGSQIKVEAFKENGIIVYRIKTVGKSPQLPGKSEESQSTQGDEPESSGDSHAPSSDTDSSSESGSKQKPLYVKESDKESTPSTKASGGLTMPPDSALLNRFISGKFCVDGGEGWWRHRVCYNRKISQYHVEMHIETSEIILGLWKQSKHLQWLKNNPDKRPLTEVEDRLEIYQYFSDGSYCDEIKAHRDAVLRIRCIKDNSSAILISFLEPTVCSYVVTIESSLFCSMVKDADEYGLLKARED